MGSNKVKPPPAGWVDARRAEGMDDDEAIKERWEKGMTNDQRRSIVGKAARLKAAQARIAAGATDSRTHTLVAQGGFRAHGDKEAAMAAIAKSRAAAAARLSAALLAARGAYTASCAVDGCPLASRGAVQLPLCLFHRDDTVARDPTAGTYVPLAVRAAASANTDCHCLWHAHALRQREPAAAAAAAAATVECQHPLHASMPYAPVADAMDGGFVRVRASGRPECAFCRRLHVMCEQAQLFDTPASQVPFQQLLRAAPAFVQRFEQETDGVDWAERRAHRSTKGKKRKRAEGEEDASASASAD